MSTRAVDTASWRPFYSSATPSSSHIKQLLHVLFVDLQKFGAQHKLDGYSQQNDSNRTFEEVRLSGSIHPHYNSPRICVPTDRDNSRLKEFGILRPAVAPESLDDDLLDVHGNRSFCLPASFWRGA